MFFAEFLYFFSPFIFLSICIDNQILDLKESAEWESKVNDRRRPNDITWHNTITNEEKKFKPKVLVSNTDKLYRMTVGNLVEFYKERTIQGYQRKIWDHNSAPRSIWGKKGPPPKKKLLNSNTVSFISFGF